MGNYLSFSDLYNYDIEGENKNKLTRNKSKKSFETKSDIFGTTHVIKNSIDNKSPNVGLPGILGGGRNKYGIKKGRVVKLYPHKISKKIGTHKYNIQWKTTRKNLPGKKFHGKFYPSKKDAEKILNKKKNTVKIIQKGGRWYDTYTRETNTEPISSLGYSAIREIAFDKKYIFNPPSQSGGSRKKRGGKVSFKRLVNYKSDLPNRVSSFR